MDSQMDNRDQSTDPEFARFDQWLRCSAVQPPADLLARVRARLAEPETAVESAIERMLQLDPGLSSPWMVQRVRRQLQQEQRETAPLPWLRWITPLAAAATLTLAVVSFQSHAPDSPLPPSTTQLGAGTAAVGEDAELTRIFALAANLSGTTDMSKLESVENLAFLFD